jgi:hypothetical protein
MKKEEEIINRYLDQRLNPEELEELDQLLQKDSLLRKKFYNQSNVVTALEEEFEQTEASPKVISISSSKTKFNLYALAACLLIGLGIFQIYFSTHSPEIIATLKENENAAWESSLPTTAGSKLRPGIMNLKAGVATIRFSSGAEITLEAPAEIEIQNPMRAKINRGNIVVHVPEPAHGFVLDTPDGYAVDHGTSFGVFVGGQGRETTFKVLEGSISVHPLKGDALFLKENESTRVSSMVVGPKNLIESTESLVGSELTVNSFRIHTNGKNLSIIRNDEFDYLDLDHLMVKLDTGNKPYERRTLINFSTDHVDWSKIKNASLRINLVPSKWGHRVYLPTTNRFTVFAVAGFTGIEWNQNLKWSESPKIEECVEVGNFEIPRSQESGSILIQTPNLLEFMKEHQSHEYTFVIIRNTSELKGSGLVHTFASDSHPESSGPSLELSY